METKNTPAKPIQDMLREWDQLDAMRANGLAKAAFLPKPLVRSVTPITESAPGTL